MMTWQCALTTATGSPPHHPWSDDDVAVHPDDGYWITRRKLHGIAPWPKTGGLGARNGRDALKDRGTHYFHSTFNDLVLSGVVGLRAHDTHLEVSPLTLLPWFAATRVRLRGVDVSVVWDAYGTKYSHGKGLHVWWNGRAVGSLPPMPPDADSVPLPPRARVTWGGESLASF